MEGARRERMSAQQSASSGGTRRRGPVRRLKASASPGGDLARKVAVSQHPHGRTTVRSSSPGQRKPVFPKGQQRSSVQMKRERFSVSPDRHRDPGARLQSSSPMGVPPTSADYATMLRRRDEDVRRLECALVGAARCMVWRSKDDRSLNEAVLRQLQSTREELERERKRREEVEQQLQRLQFDFDQMRRNSRPSVGASNVSVVSSVKTVHIDTGDRRQSTAGIERKQSDFRPSQPLVGFCNPLLDISLHVDHSFLSRWGLEPNSACLASESTIGVFEDVAADESAEYIPGGSGLNTLRVAQWILGQPGSSVFIGTTGTDEYGEKLHDTTQSEGVAMPRVEVQSQPTGTCAVLLTDKERTLVANLGASAVFDAGWLSDLPNLRGPCETAGLYYVTGFFLRTSPDSVTKLAQLAFLRGVELCLNLSAPFVCEGYTDLFRNILPEVDVVFGNGEEAVALARALGLDASSVDAAAEAIQGLPSSRASARNVIVTQGADRVVTVTDEGVKFFPTPLLPPEEIVDTNGAGDAFVGGFLARRMQGGTVSECVSAGQWAAAIIIGRPGCTLPSLPPGLLGIDNVRGTHAASQRVQQRLSARRPTICPGALKQHSREISRTPVIRPLQRTASDKRTSTPLSSPLTGRSLKRGT
eukprot:Hpha_TRINITY_DN16649_c0_g1::TRINITY_DN16649_c0_g1_i1::g.182764::m.182764/K00856/E2.7.1.20, ADK; adenosine kinase